MKHIGFCPTCYGHTWIGEPWSPTSCPDCRSLPLTPVHAVVCDPWKEAK